MSDERQVQVEITIRDAATGEAIHRIDGLATTENHVTWDTEYAKPPDGLFEFGRKTSFMPDTKVECLHLRTFAPTPLDGILYRVASPPVANAD